MFSPVKPQPPPRKNSRAAWLAVPVSGLAGSLLAWWLGRSPREIALASGAGCAAGAGLALLLATRRH
jgi:hypothetical protein